MEFSSNRRQEKRASACRKWIKENTFMAQTITLVAETGSDITKDLAQKLGVILSPMHVSMGDKTLDDGAFRRKMCARTMIEPARFRPPAAALFTTLRRSMIEFLKKILTRRSCTWHIPQSQPVLIIARSWRLKTRPMQIEFALWTQSMFLSVNVQSFLLLRHG